MNKKIFCDNKFEDFCLSLNIKSNQILKKKNPITYSCTATASLYFFSVLRISKKRETRKKKERRETKGGEQSRNGEETRKRRREKEKMNLD